MQTTYQIRILTITMLLFSSTLSFGVKKPPSLNVYKAVSNGSPKAVKGGTFIARISVDPATLLDEHDLGDAYAQLFTSFVRGSLLTADWGTDKDLPYVAKDWWISDDKLKAGFTLDPRARFSDGSEVTADDVVFTWDKIFDKKEKTASARSFYSFLKSWKKIDKYNVEFEFNRVHFMNIRIVGSKSILQKSFYGAKGKNFSKDFHKVIVGSGPYIYDKKNSRKSRQYVFLRNKNYWKKDDLSQKYRHNFDKIIYKVVKDDRVAFEMLKRGDLHFLEFKNAMMDTWVKETATKEFTKGPIEKFTYPMIDPVTWRGIALNMRSGPLKDWKFRDAVQKVFNSDYITKKLFHGLQEPLKGPWTNYNPYASQKLQPPPFDPKSAAKNLKELGYTKADSDGILYRTKDGKKQRAEFRVIYAYDGHEKWLTEFKADARKVGINVKLDLMEWAAASKDFTAWNFGGMVIAWVGGAEPQPQQLWSTSTAKEKGSSNLSGFSNKRVDELIDIAAREFDEEKRYKFYREMEELIVKDHPYVWAWQQKNYLMAYNKVEVAIPRDKNGKLLIYKYSGDSTRLPPIEFWWKVSKKPSKKK